MFDYFSLEDLRDLPDLSNQSRFSDERLEAAHDWIVSIIERECDTSFVHREVTERLSGDGSNALVLSSPYVVSIVALSVGGIAAGDPSALFLDSGILWAADCGRWDRGRGNVSVTYTAGWSEVPPADLREAAKRAARVWLLTNDQWSAKDARATSITNDMGTIALTVAGDNRPTGLPDADATIMAWARRVRVPKVS